MHIHNYVTCNFQNMEFTILSEVVLENGNIPSYDWDATQPPTENNSGIYTSCNEAKLEMDWPTY